jgi:hypothetical protein
VKVGHPGRSGCGFAKEPGEVAIKSPAAAVLCGYIPGGRMREREGEVLEVWRRRMADETANIDRIARMS